MMKEKRSKNKLAFTAVLYYNYNMKVTTITILGLTLIICLLGLRLPEYRVIEWYKLHPQKIGYGILYQLRYENLEYLGAIYCLDEKENFKWYASPDIIITKKPKYSEKYNHTILETKIDGLSISWLKKKDKKFIVGMDDYLSKLDELKNLMSERQFIHHSSRKTNFFYVHKSKLIEKKDRLISPRGKITTIWAAVKSR